MTEDRISLDQVAEQLSPPEDPFERLTTRKRRRRIRQRVTAGVTGLLIAAVGSTSMFIAARALSDKPVPVYPAARPTPSVAEIICDGQTANVLTPVVQVQRDGVHFRFTNTAAFEVRIVTGAGDSNGSPTVPAGATVETTTERLYPGSSKVWCGTSAKDVNDGPPQSVLHVVDPEGLWVSTKLQCPDGRWTGTPGGLLSDVPSAQDFDPVQRTRDIWARALRPADVVERAGYTQGPLADSMVRVVRGGDVLALKTFMLVPGGLYDNGEYIACNDFNNQI